MANYYLKMDNIMKNMFVVALNDELALDVLALQRAAQQGGSGR